MSRRVFQPAPISVRLTSLRTLGLASFALSSALTLSCQRTAEGAKEDALAASSAANDGAEQAKQSLQVQMDAFKAQTNAQLERLSVSLSQLEAQTNAGIDDSKQKLQAEIDATKEKLARLKAESGTELEAAKTDIGASMSDLGRRLDHSLDEAGDKVRKTIE